jgi:hypothetical protein
MKKRAGNDKKKSIAMTIREAGNDERMSKGKLAASLPVPS